MSDRRGRKEGKTLVHLYSAELNHLYLHEETSAERFANVDVVIPAGEFCAPAGQIEAVHDPGQLLPHIVGGH